MATRARHPAGKSVLVVEDEVEINNFLRETLKSKGYHVASSHNSDEAIENMRSQNFGVILIDINLPGMDGVELFRHCRSSTPDSVVIMITGSPSYDAAISLIKEGAFDFMPKPFRLETLMKKVTLAFQQHELRVEKSSTATVKMEKCYIPGYKYVKKIGSGNMGEVALVKKDDQRFAIKRLRRVNDNADLSYKIERFFSLMTRVSAINHPNIIKILGFGLMPDGSNELYVLMEYFHGSTLSKHIGKSFFTIPEKLRILEKIAAALGHVHAEGVLHRDIKPSNILVDDSQNVKITDFGVSCLIHKGGSVTESLKGSPAYMAPECFDSGESVGPGADVFSFGILAYELLTGLRPFYGENLKEMMDSIRGHRPAAPRLIINGIPEEIQDLIGAALNKNPAERPSMRQIHESLAEFNLRPSGDAHSSLKKFGSDGVWR